MPQSEHVQSKSCALVLVLVLGPGLSVGAGAGGDEAAASGEDATASGEDATGGGVLDLACLFDRDDLAAAFGRWASLLLSATVSCSGAASAGGLGCSVRVGERAADASGYALGAEAAGLTAG